MLFTGVKLEDAPLGVPLGLEAMLADRACGQVQMLKLKVKDLREIRYEIYVTGCVLEAEKPARQQRCCSPCSCSRSW